MIGLLIVAIVLLLILGRLAISHGRPRERVISKADFLGHGVASGGSARPSMGLVQRGQVVAQKVLAVGTASRSVAFVLTCTLIAFATTASPSLGPLIAIVLIGIVAITTVPALGSQRAQSPSAILRGIFATIMSCYTSLAATTPFWRLTSASLDTRGQDLSRGRFSVITRSLAGAAGLAFIAVASLWASTDSALAGDAGLASSSGSNWALFAITGAAFALAGLALLKFARRA